MKVGVLAVPMPPFESFRTTIAAAEELGVDSFWVPDHLLGVANPTSRRHDAVIEQRPQFNEKLFQIGDRGGEVVAERHQVLGLARPDS